MDKKAAASGGSSKLNDYEILTKLGQGSFGIVYKVKRKTDQKIYVLKKIDISQMSTAQRKEAVHEATILSKINSPYIVKFYDSFTDRTQINIIMEYCENGDLGIYLKRQMGRQLSEAKIWKFFVEMCLGMQYLHHNKILHRDIKTINMFLTKEDKIKIGDLGVAKMLNQTANFAHTVVGTPYYLSPELCEEKPYNHKSDVWSLGCVLYELITLKHPFEANNQGALILKIVRGKYNPISSQYSKDLSNMVDQLLSKDYKKRPSIQDILNMPVMQEKSSYFGYGVTKPESLMAAPTQPKNNAGIGSQSQPPPQQRESAMPQEQIKKINDAAAQLRQNNQKPGGAAIGGNNSKELISQREKNYQQNLIDAAQKQKQERLERQNKLLEQEREKQQQQQQLQLNGAKQVIQQKPTVQNNVNIPSSYVDPSKRQPQQNNNLLNNNQFDQKEYEKKQQNLIQLQKQQQQQQQNSRPQSNQNGRGAKEQISAQQKQQQSDKSNQQQQQKEPIISAQNLNQQYVQAQQQLKGIPQNQRVKSGAPQQLSRQAQMAQKQGQRLIKQGETDRPQIIKPDIKALRQQQSDQGLVSKQQQQNPLLQPNNKPSTHSGGKNGNSSHEINEVMNLPDDLDKKKQNQAGSHQPKSNSDLIAEAQRKRDALNRVNNKFQSSNDKQQNIGADLSGKAASQLHDMKLVVPSGKNSQYDTPHSHSASHSREPSTQFQSKIYDNEYSGSYDDYGESSHIGQKQLDDDEFAELLNGGGGSSEFVQPTWNINGHGTGMRDTQFVPCFEENKDGDDDDEVFKVHHDNNFRGPGGRRDKKMNTIKEDKDEEDRKSNGSDTAYFSPDQDINDRDDYDSDEEERYQERMRQLHVDDNEDDEDNQPYDFEDQQRKEKEEFGDSDNENYDDEDDEEEKDQIAQMSMTMQDRKKKEMVKELRECKHRQNELERKIQSKVEEGAAITKSVPLFEKCFKLFCDKAQNSEELSDKDYLEINEFIERHVGQQNLQLTPILFQLYFFKEEIPSIKIRIQELESDYLRLTS